MVVLYKVNLNVTKIKQAEFLALLITKEVALSMAQPQKVELMTLVEGHSKAPFSIVITLRCRGGCYSISWIAPLYP